MTDPLEAFTVATGRPGNTLLFIDDTEFHGHLTPGLVSDLRVLAGIRFDSAFYPEIDGAMRERLARLGQREFHAAEIVNPKTESPWRNVTRADRVAALDLLSELIEHSNASMLYGYVSQSQYKDLRDGVDDVERNKVPLDRNSGLKSSFLRWAMVTIAEEQRPGMIMIDQDRARQGIELDGSEDAPWLIGGGILTAPSHLVSGIQLADALAFAIGRRFRRGPQFAEGKANDLDEAAIGPLAALSGRSRSLFRERIYDESARGA